MKRISIAKRAALCAAAASVLLALSACGVSQGDYDQAVADKEKAEQQLADLQAEYDAYKEKMKPYEEMTEAQAEAEKAKAEEEKRLLEEQEAARKAEEEAAAAQQAAEEEAARAAEEAMGYETGITYDQLARTPDDYIGSKVMFYGKVIQVIESDNKVQIRLAVDDNYDTVLLGEYESSIVSSRVLDNDYITIYGISVGTITYQSTMGGNITIPGVLVERIDQ